jgi:uncharacterized protein
MIVVLDTNVIVSALLSPYGTTGEILHLLENGDITVATSDVLLLELEHVLHYSKIQRQLKLSEIEISLFIRRFTQFANVVNPEINLKIIEKDPEDDHVLECAITAKASIIISGDQHLLEIKNIQGIEILSPKAFLTWFPTKDY